MNKYASWVSDTFAVTDLLLDPENPRLSELGHQASTREIVAELVKHEGVFELSRDIANQGYFPTEILACIEENGVLTVVEGNRRLASLKLLISPELAPADFVPKFRKLSRKATEVGITTQVSAVIAPSRSAAAPLIMNRHTQTGIRRWEPIQQAKYINSLLATGISIAQVSQVTGFPKAQLIQNLRTHNMYEIAARLKLDEKAAATVRDARKFNISTLERVIGSTKMRGFLGIDFDAEGNVLGSVHPEDFKKAYRKIVSDITSGEVDTRKLNNDKAIDEYIHRIETVRPKRAGSFTSGSLTGGSEVTGAAKKPEEGKGKRGRVSSYLVPKTLKCHLEMPRIREVLRELQHLKVNGFENAVGVLLRIFIEMSVSHYMEETGRMKTLVARLDKDNRKPKGWTPSFRQMLSDLLQNDNFISAAIPKQALKALNKAVSDDDHPLSLGTC
ncbi:MAG: hypothetical protein WBW84_17000 [Acidobacteriaceae bacterium]